MTPAEFTSAIAAWTRVVGHEQAEADRADAERFRWLVDHESYTGDGLDRDCWSHSIAWSTHSGEPNIRAAIDEAMRKGRD